MDNSDKLIEAQNVGESFCMYYLKKASEAPGDLHKFYKSNAVCSFGSDATVCGSDKIKEKLEKLSGARFSVLPDSGGSFHFQPTPNAGVLIMVSGLVWFMDPVTKVHATVPMRFVQTALLVREQDSKFFIANDMHQFFEVNNDQAATAVQEEPVVEKTVEQPKEAEVEKAIPVVEKPKKKEEPVKEEVAPVVAEQPAAAAAAPKEPQATKPVKEARPPKTEQKRVRNAPKQAPPVAAAATVVVAATPAAAPLAPAVPKGPMSYSQIAKSQPAAAAVPAAAPVAAVAAPKPVTPPPATAVVSQSSSILVKFSETARLSPLMLSAAFKPLAVAKAVVMNNNGSAKLTFGSAREVSAILSHTEKFTTADGHELKVEANTASHNNTPTTPRSTTTTASKPSKSTTPSNGKSTASFTRSSSSGRSASKPSFDKTKAAIPTSTTA